MMIEDLLLTEEMDSKVMARVRGGFTGLRSWFLPTKWDIQSEKDKVDDDQSQVQFEIQ